MRDVSIEDISMPNNTLSKRCDNRIEPDKGMPSINTVVLITSNFMNANNIVNVVNIKRANTRDMSCGETTSEKRSKVMKTQEMASKDEYIGVQMSSLLFVRNLFSPSIAVSVETID